MEMVSCDICGKEFKNTQGLRGHKNFVHSDAIGGVGQPVTQQTAKQLLSSNLGTRVATEQQVSKLEDRFQNLERVTGLRETRPADLLNDLLSNTEPLTYQLASITRQLSKQAEQLSKLSDTVSKLSEDVELARVSKAMVDADKAHHDNRLEELSQKYRDAHNKLAAVVNNNSEQLNKSTAMFEGKLGSDEKSLHETNKCLDKVEAQLVKDRDALKSIEQSVNSLKADMVDMRRHILRRPTDNVITLRLTDGRDHGFKEYKSPQGLRKPHKTTTDWISGDKWVDLSEPED